MGEMIGTHPGEGIGAALPRSAGIRRVELLGIGDHRRGEYSVGGRGVRLSLSQGAWVLDGDSGDADADTQHGV